MLDLKRLENSTLLRASGWTPFHSGHLQKRLAQISRSDLQVPPEAIFPAAWEVIESLDGICIKNQCPELGLGRDCCAIEFDFFNYDDSVSPELQTIGAKIGRPVIFLGIGYDIAGDWLLDDAGTLYFRNKLTGKLFLFSDNIYCFLEKDIFGYTARDGCNIFPGQSPEK